MLMRIDSAVSVAERPGPIGGGMKWWSNLHQMSESLGNAVDAKDATTYHHSQGVAEISRLLAGITGLTGYEVEAIHLAGHLHDIGKIGIPDAVLRKIGKLNDAEWHWVRKHPEIGARIVRPVEAFNGPGGIADMILAHHERFDGS